MILATMIFHLNFLATLCLRGKLYGLFYRSAIAFFSS